MRNFSEILCISAFVAKKTMKSITKCFLSLFLLAPMFLFSQESKEIPVKDPAKLIGQVSLFSQKTTSITADFTQVKEMSFMEEWVTSSGKFYFQKENLLRWEYNEPFQYSIIVNGDRIRIIDEGKSKDFETGSNRMFLEISSVMTGMVNGTLLNSDQFTTRWFEADSYYKAELIPAGAMIKDYLAHIELKLNKSDYSVDELKMFEKSGDYTLITFRNKKLNETIPADIFRLD
jgi:outer membrane lipoprotein-sorting protein